MNARIADFGSGYLYISDNILISFKKQLSALFKLPAFISLGLRFIFLRRLLCRAGVSLIVNILYFFTKLSVFIVFDIIISDQKKANAKYDDRRHKNCFPYNLAYAVALPRQESPNHVLVCSPLIA